MPERPGPGARLEEPAVASVTCGASMRAPRPNDDPLRSDAALLRSDTRNVRAAQTRAGVPAATLSRELRAIDGRGGAARAGGDARGRWVRALLQPRGQSDRAEDDRGDRRGPGARGPRRHSVDSGSV